MTIGLKNLSKRSFLMVIAIWITLFSALAVSAQGIPTPINIGENKTGEITATVPSVSYSVTAASPQAVQIQVLGITQGFAPAFQVFDPSGVVVQTAANASAQASVQAIALLSDAGPYRIDVQSANGQVGQFLISLQAGPPLQPPQPLAVGQTLNGSVSSEVPLQSYAFPSSQTDVLLLTFRSETPTGGPIVTLSDADTGETLAVNSSRLAGARYRIPSGLVNYLVEITSSGALNAENFAICLESENGPLTCSGGQQVVAPTAVVPTQVLPTLPATGPCVVAPASGGAINVRSGPGTNYSVVTQLTANTTAAVVGHLPDNSWYQVNVNGILGWTSATVVRLGGECGTVPAVTLTPTTTGPTATSAPTTSGATPTATSTPTSAATLSTFPVTLVVGTLVVAQPLDPHLDYTASPNYGQANLAAGFTPDPYSVGMTSGGSVDVSYLGGGCAGFATAAPDLRVSFSGGGSTLLRFYFVGNADTTMIVNDPYGNFYCVDDSFGSVNPTIDFNNPAGGTYDIWVGSYSQGTAASGTLYITEASGNHP